MSSKCCDNLIGEMRHQVVIQSVSRATDSQGGYVESWSTHATVWAKIEPVKPRQVFQAEQLQHRVTHKITIRYLSTLAIDMRISFSSRFFHVRGFRNLEERNEFHEIDAEEGVPS